MLLRRLISLLVILAHWLIVHGATAIRIVEGIDKVSHQAATDSNQLNPVHPAPYYGPDSLHALHGQCFQGLHERSIVTVCPFHNVTSRRSSGTPHQQRPTLIGVWGKWIWENNNIPYSHSFGINQVYTDSLHDGDVDFNGHGTVRYGSMLYYDGQPCAGSTKSATILLECAQHGDIHISRIEDKSHCEMRIFLSLPFDCSFLYDERIDQPNTAPEIIQDLTVDSDEVVLNATSSYSQINVSSCVCPAQTCDSRESSISTQRNASKLNETLIDMQKKV